MRRLAEVTAIVLATMTVALGLWELRSALVLFMLAIATSATVRPMVDFWVRRGAPPVAALAITWVLGLLGPAALLLYFASNPLADDLQGIADGLLPPFERLRDHWAHGNALERLIAEHVPTPAVARLGSSSLSDVLPPALGLGVGLFQLLGELVIVVILSIFWTANREMFERLWLSLVPAAHRPFARATWFEVKRGVGQKVRADVAEGALAASALYVGFLAIGLEHPFVPAIAGGLFRIVPLVGWLLAVLTTFTSGLVTDPALALYASVYTAIVLLVIEALVAPRLIRARRYSPFLCIFSAVALAELGGLIGLVVAPVIAAAVQILFEQYVSSFEVRPAGAQASTDELRARLDALRSLMASSPDLAAAPELASLAERLTRLIDATEEAIESGALGQPEGSEAHALALP